MLVIPERIGLLSRKIQEEKKFVEYLQGLKYFWNQEYSKCLDHIYNKFMEDSNPELMFPYYRLWIEVLSEQKEFSSLQLIGRHLFKRSTESAYPNSWMALIGLVHLELDEWEACELIMLALDENYNCPYTLEFFQRCNLRIRSESEGYLLNLEYCQTDIVDYFHWLQLARGYLLCGASKELEHIIDFIQIRYINAPMKDEFYARIFLDELDVAKKYSNKLKSRYPKNYDYLYFNAYILRSAGEYKNAIRLFSHLLHYVPDDPDVYSELAFCHDVLSDDDKFSFHWEKAKKYYEEAEKKYAELGFPTTEVSLKKIKFQDIGHEEQPEEVSSEPLKYWFLNISQRRMSDFIFANEEDEKIFLKDFSSKIKKNHYVFIVYDNPRKQDSLCLVALFQVLIDPIWHPIYRRHSALELIKKFDCSIELGKVTLPHADRRSHARDDDPSSSGFLEMDHQSLNTVKNSIMSFYKDIKQKYDDIFRSNAS